MDSEFGGKACNFRGVMVPNLKGIGKKSLEWDLNDFKWDGDLFTASPLNSTPFDGRSRQLFPARPETPSDAGLSNSSSSGSDNISPGNEKDQRELEKRRRNEKDQRELEKRRRDVFVENRELNDEAASLNLKLGGQTYPIMEEEVQTGKKTKTIGTTSNRAVCQVEDCKADLSNAKDYHRRHKVCNMHSKATKALVGSVMQRFCQQCSRFHALQEFDEGKRSCRRRLAGHNRRRRKTHPDTAVNGGSLNNEGGSGYLLISLLRILSNMHSSSSDQTKDQDVISHLLRSLANVAGTADGRNISTLMQGSQGLFNSGTSVQTARRVLDMNVGVNTEDPLRSKGHCSILPASRDSSESKSVTPEATSRRFQLNDIDLNSTYDDSHDYVENLGNSHVPASPGTASLGFPSWMQRDSHKSSPPQTSGNSDLTSTQSPSSSSGEAQSHTDRIVFKLFGKDPNELPLALRSQILDWLSHSPTNIESYIRPGCIILTIYLRLEKSTWEEFCCHLGSSLKTLLDAADDPFWRTGWVYTRVQDYVAFTYNGEVVLDTPLPLKSNKSCRISCIKPIAISLSERAEFIVKGFNLSSSTTRLLCALEGKYLAQETCYDLLDDADSTVEDDEQQCLKFSCSIPNVTGRGFIEVEDHGLSSSFFPFIVAEQEVCSEICMLEDVIEVSETDDDIQSGPDKVEAKNQALDFIHELGWLLHRSRVKFRLGQLDPNLDTFPFRRFRLLMEFSIDHDWCAVVKKLLGILFDGTVDAGEHPSLESALLDMGLLHRAVRINSRRMVEFLLRFVPGLTGSEQKEQVDRDSNSFLFKPDVVGPMGLTPLHIAASTDGCEQVLDALTDDPGKVGIKVWKNARDSTGLTPYDYACLRSRYSYVHMVQRKISNTLESGHVVLDIPGLTLDRNGKQKQSDAHKSSRVASLETEKNEIKAILRHCRLCEQKPAYSTTRSLVYRPAMLSMVAVAAVCVCAALLFKSNPEVVFVLEPFRWEHLKFGSS